MRLRAETKILKAKAECSLRRAVTAFNTLREDDGRATEVLLTTQHAFEMLLKAVLTQKALRVKSINVFDPKSRTSIGYEKCVKLGREHVPLSEEDAGTLRAIDALRDVEQHWHGIVSEAILYSHMRAAVTIFDDILQRFFGEQLADRLPARILPVSTEPPRDIQLLIDEEFTQVQRLLAPRRRGRAEAGARIRTLLALEAHTTEETVISERDVAQAARQIKAGSPRSAVFPALAPLDTNVDGEGLSLTLHFSRTGKGAPVHYVTEGVGAFGIQKVDLSAKYHMSRTDLAKKLGLRQQWERLKALRWHCDIDDEVDDDYHHAWRQQSTTIHGYSDRAYQKMKDALESPGFNLAQVLRDYRQSGRTHE
ncbi:hypothetical protein QMK19_30215 [Streptomyces sp. H10-C2]|uniref:hypothetical protein n=1 Tax=unclassified Streptomyces TaxID=2593676 RepID=UPI0024BAEA29|nr:MULTISPECIES: hypothetical protein [unclassified Streptomyces]MDJ0344933.1 hypothetical protein [Streptomyces sp. PH10-H1]MDJ0373809.1 hypothetical protein [Streptomyces sp. H10-C2]